MNRRPSHTRTTREPLRYGRYRTTTPEDFLRRSRGKRGGSRLLQAAGVLVLAVLLINAALNRFVCVTRVSVPITGLSAGLDGFTILHLSDLKGATFGQGQHRLAHALRDAHFDAVVLSGDMVSAQGNAQPLYDLIDALHALNPDAPIWFIAGDSDPEPVSMQNAAAGSPYAPWVLGARQHGAQLLGAPVPLAQGEQTIWLAASSDLSLDIGAQQARFETRLLEAQQNGDGNATDLVEYTLSRLTGLREAQREMRPDDVMIAVSHTPLDEHYLQAIRSPAGREIQLLLCGHWLGGLVRLPLVGSLFIPSGLLPHYGLLSGNTWYGLSRQGGSWIYCSAGLGAWDALYPPFFRRFANPPQASLLTLIPSTL